MTGFPIAAGILTIIASCLAALTGLLLMAISLLGVFIGIFGIFVFAFGLTGGNILSKKETLCFVNLRDDSSNSFGVFRAVFGCVIGFTVHRIVIWNAHNHSLNPKRYLHCHI
jgi:hypothetical protein